MTQRRLDGPAFAMVLALAALWGGAFVLNEIILTALPVFTMVALRVSLAALTLWAIIIVIGRPVPRTVGIWLAFAVMGFFNNAVPFSLIVWGQSEITAGLAAILNATTPLFTGLLAGLVLADERLSASRLTGLAVGLVGVAVMIGPDALSAFGTDIAAQLAILGAALSYAVSAVFARRFQRFGLAPIVVAAGQTTMSSMILLPAAIVLERPFELAMPSPMVWTCLVALACLATAIAYILYFAIIARAGATNAALVTVLVPVFAILIGMALLGETITMAELAGMALIAGGLAIVDGRVLRAKWGATARAPPTPRG